MFNFLVYFAGVSRTISIFLISVSIFLFILIPYSNGNRIPALWVYFLTLNIMIAVILPNKDQLLKIATTYAIEKVIKLEPYKKAKNEQLMVLTKHLASLIEEKEKK